MHDLDLIDRVHSEGSVTDGILCEKRVPLHSPVFRGHFPGFPVVAGALLIECMAQAGGLLLMRDMELRRMALLAAVREARFYQFVEPGSQLLIRARSIALRARSALVAAELHVDGARCARCRLLYQLRDFPTPETRNLIARRLRMTARTRLAASGQGRA